MKLRTRVGVFVSAVVSLLGLGAVVAVPAAFAVDSIGPYQVINYNSGLCMDVAHASTATNSAVIQYGCHHGANQLWHFVHYYAPGDTHFWIQPDHMISFIPQGCLEIPTFNRLAGGDAKIFTCDYFTNEAVMGWSLLPSGGSALPTPGAQYRYRFVNWSTNMCLEVDGGSDSPGAVVQQAPCDGTAKQYWIVIP